MWVLPLCHVSPPLGDTRVIPVPGIVVEVVVVVGVLVVVVDVLFVYGVRVKYSLLTSFIVVWFRLRIFTLKLLPVFWDAVVMFHIYEPLPLLPMGVLAIIVPISVPVFSSVIFTWVPEPLV